MAGISALRVAHVTGVATGGVVGGAVVGMVLPDQPSRTQRAVPTAAAGVVLAGAAHLVIGSRVRGAAGLSRASTAAALGAGAITGAGAGIATTEIRLRRNDGTVILPIPEDDAVILPVPDDNLRRPDEGGRRSLAAGAGATAEPPAVPGATEVIELGAERAAPTPRQGAAELDRATALLRSLDKPIMKADTLDKGAELNVWNRMIMTSAALNEGLRALDEHRPDQLQLIMELDAASTFMRKWGYAAMENIRYGQGAKQLDLEDRQFFRDGYRAILERTPRAAEVLRQGALPARERAAVLLDRSVARYADFATQFSGIARLEHAEQVDLLNNITASTRDGLRGARMLEQALPQQRPQARKLAAKINELDGYAIDAIERLIWIEGTKISPAEAVAVSKRLNAVSRDATAATRLLRVSPRAE